MPEQIEAEEKGKKYDKEYIKSQLTMLENFLVSIYDDELLENNSRIYGNVFEKLKRDKPPLIFLATRLDSSAHRDKGFMKVIEKVSDNFVTSFKDDTGRTYYNATRGYPGDQFLIPVTAFSRTYALSDNFGEIENDKHLEHLANLNENGDSGVSEPAESNGDSGVSEPAESNGDSGVSEPAESNGDSGASEPTNNNEKSQPCVRDVFATPTRLELDAGKYPWSEKLPQGIKITQPNLGVGRLIVDTNLFIRSHVMSPCWENPLEPWNNLTPWVKILERVKTQELSTIEKEIKEIEDNIEKIIKEIKDNIGKRKSTENIEEPEEEIKNLEEEIKNLEEEIKNLEEEIKNLEEEIKNLEEEIKNLEEEIKNLEEGNFVSRALNKEKLKELKEKLKKLQKDLEELKKEKDKREKKLKKLLLLKKQLCEAVKRRTTLNKRKNETQNAVTAISEALDNYLKTPAEPPKGKKFTDQLAEIYKHRICKIEGTGKGKSTEAKALLKVTPL